MPLVDGECGERYEEYPAGARRVVQDKTEQGKDGRIELPPGPVRAKAREKLIPRVEEGKVPHQDYRGKKKDPLPLPS